MISRRNSRFIWKAHFHLIGCRFDEILWSILFVYWGISMTPLMMSALTSHTTLKHNYYYTTQHLHCDITDISNSPCNFDAGSLSIGWSAVLTTLWSHSDDILTTIWPHFDYILTPCNFDAGSLSIGWSAVRWRPVQLSRLLLLLRPDYSDYGQQGSVVRSK